MSALASRPVGAPNVVLNLNIASVLKLLILGFVDISCDAANVTQKKRHGCHLIEKKNSK